MRIAIADPPYIGQAAKHYADHPDYAGEVDHYALVAQLERDFDAWALCLSSVTLYLVLQCLAARGVQDYRVGAWVKTFASFKPGVNPGYAWEPVIFRGGRKLGRDVPTVRDWIAEPITLQRGVAGAKPEKVCWWMFDFLGLQPEDEFHDLFPGSGAVTRAWERYCTRARGEQRELVLL